MCGLADHLDQIEKYPVGTKVHLLEYGEATVTGHCDDGRAVFDVGEAGHTFHYVDSWVASVELPPVDVKDARIAELEAEVAQLKAGTWQPIHRTKVQCTEFSTGGANQIHDYLVVWSDELNEGTVHLPDDVRLCRKVTTE